MNPTVEFYLEDLRTKFSKINPEDYYLSYSGGKDSHFLLWFIKDFARIEGIEIVGINTYMEHPQILKRIMDYSDVVLKPKLKPQEIKEAYGIPCFSKWQDEMISRYQKGLRSPNTVESITGENRTVYKVNKTAKMLTLSGDLHKVSNKCCKIIKKDTVRDYEKLSKRKAIIGVRSSESMMRKQQYTSCFTKSGNFTPIHDLPSSWLDVIYEEFNIEIPEIYNHIERTGCMGCPYGSHRGNTQKELKLLNKNQLKFVTEYFKESYEVLGIEVED